jgi:hypothetical protein
MIDSGALTDLVLEHLSVQTEVVIGDNAAPINVGWLKGQPNQNVFKPYAVLITSGGNVREQANFTGIDPTWAVTWSLRTFGGSRKQVDWAAFVVRQALEGLMKQTFGSDPVYKIHAVEWQSLGSVNRLDTTDPPFWQIYDTFVTVCSR